MLILYFSVVIFSFYFENKVVGLKRDIPKIFFTSDKKALHFMSKHLLEIILQLALDKTEV